MTGWILSIVGTVLTVTLAEVMLPEGQTAKFIKGVISLMIIYVVIAPIPALLQSKIDVNAFFDFSSGGYRSDESFIEIIKEDKQSAISREFNQAFEERGLTSASVAVLLDGNYEVAQVLLTTSKRDLDEAYRLIVHSLGVKEERIVVNEVFT